MTRINSADQLAALMRVQIAALRQGRTPQEPTLGSSSRGSTSQSRTQGDLASIAAERIRGIAADDPGRDEKALRIFLESVLLTELGAELVSDPAFGAMVDHVLRQFQADPALAHAAANASAALLKSVQS